MRKLYFLLSLLGTIGLIFVLNNSFHTTKVTVPAVGKFLNPMTGFWTNGEPNEALPITFPIESDSLVGDVKVVFDDRLVPHIFAENTADAYFAQGYITAQHRLWQMDFVARDAAGRLSEVVGEKTLKRDKYKRRLGLDYAAENMLKTWKSDTIAYKLAEAYTAGVNAYIETLHPKNFPLEYKLLDYMPEKWTTKHSALVAKSMAETLAFRTKDIKATNAKAFFSEGAFNFLYPETFPEQRPVIPKEVPYAFEDEAVNKNTTLAAVDGYLGSVDLEVNNDNLGSNNWAIARGKTVNGNAILAGDPHLYLTLPSVWFEVQIHTPESNVYGVSLPGLPGVIIGFNEHISWSVTNAAHDVADFYTIEWKDSLKQEYLLDSQMVKCDKRVEEFIVKNGFSTEEIIDTVRYTHWGPIIHETDENQPDLALRWLVHDTPKRSDADVFYQINKAKNIDEFQAALKKFSTPAQNFSFASTKGDIGMFVQGVFPKKRKGQGRFIQDGTKSENGWQGEIPENHLPKVVNPAWGYVGSANQQSTTENYPYYYNSEFFEPYRGRRVQLSLTPNTQFTEKDMRDLQQDSYSIKVEDLFEMMMTPLDFGRMNDAEKAIFSQLEKWNYRYERDLLTPVYFEEWFRIFYKKTWDELSEQTQYEDILYPSHWRTVYIMRDLPESSFFDIKSTPERETVTDIITTAFQEMVAEVAAKIIVEPDLNWSNYRNTKVSHIAQIDAFSHKNVYTDGYGKALNAVTARTGPSWRMVVEMSDTPSAKVVYPGGQSGNPGSKYYDDFLDEWADGQYFDALYMQSAEEGSERVIFAQEFKTTAEKSEKRLSDN